MISFLYFTYFDTLVGVMIDSKHQRYESSVWLMLSIRYDGVRLDICLLICILIRLFFVNVYSWLVCIFILIGCRPVSDVYGYSYANGCMYVFIYTL